MSDLRIVSGQTAYHTYYFLGIKGERVDAIRTMMLNSLFTCTFAIVFLLRTLTNGIIFLTVAIFHPCGRTILIP